MVLGKNVANAYESPTGGGSEWLVPTACRCRYEVKGGMQQWPTPE